MAALVAVSCAVGACQQHERIRGEVLLLPSTTAVPQGTQDAKGAARAHASHRPDIASGKGKPSMIGKVREEPKTAVHDD